MERKLYGLEAINSQNLTDRVKIKMNSEDGRGHEYKSTLHMIDKNITSYFSNKQQLLNYFISKGIITDKYDDIKITYRYRGIRTIEPVFSSDEIIKKVSENATSNVDTNKNQTEYNYIVDTFVKYCKEDNFFNMILKSEQIPEHLKDRANQLNKFIDSGSNEDAHEKIEIINSIKNMLASYKTFRTIAIYIDSYLKQKELSVKQSVLPEIPSKQQQLKTEVVEEDLDEKEEFLTEEEIEETYKGSNPTR